MRLFGNIEDRLEMLKRRVEDLHMQVMTDHARIEELLGPANTLLEAEAERRYRSEWVLWASLNPQTGQIEHKYVDQDGIGKFLGTRYHAALDGLREARLGEVIYIDGALFVKMVTGGKEPMGTKRYDLNA